MAIATAPAAAPAMSSSIEGGSMMPSLESPQPIVETNPPLSSAEAAANDSLVDQVANNPGNALYDIAAYKPLEHGNPDKPLERIDDIQQQIKEKQQSVQDLQEGEISKVDDQTLLQKTQQEVGEQYYETWKNQWVDTTATAYLSKGVPLPENIVKDPIYAEALTTATNEAHARGAIADRDAITRDALQKYRASKDKQIHEEEGNQVTALTIPDAMKGDPEFNRRIAQQLLAQGGVRGGLPAELQNDATFVQLVGEEIQHANGIVNIESLQKEAFRKYHDQWSANWVDSVAKGYLEKGQSLDSIPQAENITKDPLYQTTFAEMTHRAYMEGRALDKNYILRETLRQYRSQKDASLLVKQNDEVPAGDPAPSPAAENPSASLIQPAEQAGSTTDVLDSSPSIAASTGTSVDSEVQPENTSNEKPTTRVENVLAHVDEAQKKIKAEQESFNEIKELDVTITADSRVADLMTQLATSKGWQWDAVTVGRVEDAINYARRQHYGGQKQEEQQDVLSGKSGGVQRSDEEIPAGSASSPISAENSTNTTSGAGEAVVPEAVPATSEAEQSATSEEKPTEVASQATAESEQIKSLEEQIAKLTATVEKQGEIIAKLIDHGNETDPEKKEKKWQTILAMAALLGYVVGGQIGDAAGLKS